MWGGKGFNAGAPCSLQLSLDVKSFNMFVIA